MTVRNGRGIFTGTSTAQEEFDDEKAMETNKSSSMHGVQKLAARFFLSLSSGFNYARMFLHLHRPFSIRLP